MRTWNEELCSNASLTFKICYIVGYTGLEARKEVVDGAIFLVINSILTIFNKAVELNKIDLCSVKGQPVHSCTGPPSSPFTSASSLHYPLSSASLLLPLAYKHVKIASVIKKPHPSLFPFPEKLLETVVNTCCSISSPPFSLEPTAFGLLSPSCFQNSSRGPQQPPCSQSPSPALS